MHLRASTTTAVRLCLMIVPAVIAAGPLFAQGSPAALVSNYGLVHLYGLPTATTTRLFGMGGMTACVPDSGFPNPAFAGDLATQHAGLRYSLTDFDAGLQLNALQSWYNTPLGSRDGIQVLVFWLDSDTGGLATPGGMVNASLYEGDISLHYGRRVNDRLLVGVGISPVMNTSTWLTDPASGATIQKLESRVGFGGRVGVVYQATEQTTVGAVCDIYSEDVRMTSPIATPEVSFDATEYAIGISHRATPELLLAAEWCELKNEAGPVENIASGWHFGAEYMLTPQTAVRVGGNDGQISAGLGFDGGTWAANYSYIKDWNDESVGAFLGGSDTQQLEITASWR
ncbi:MAG: hypothetical protein J7M38_10660 [Armatimonadetes bacterium]|nr:hypothetical protein [Armatimonadota bacterium]